MKTDLTGLPAEEQEALVLRFARAVRKNAQHAAGLDFGETGVMYHRRNARGLGGKSCSK